MIDSKRNNFVLFFMVLGLFAWAFWLQDSILFNADVSWLMLAAKRLCAGGNYTHDFFEINPPVILYIYCPAVLLGKWLHLSAHDSLHIYVFALIFASWFFSYKLSAKIIADGFVRQTFLLALAAVLLLIPLNDFGQREQLVMIFTLPYLLLMSLRLQGGKINPGFAAMVGVFAACGFFIKPFFLIPLIFVEAFYLWQQWNWRTFFRAEIYAIIGVVVVFISLILIFNRDYLSVVVPIVAQFYYAKSAMSLSAVLGNEEAVFSYFALGFYFLRAHYQRVTILATVLMLADSGFTLAYVLQQTPWYYHLIPVIICSCLLFILLFSQLVQQKNISRGEYVSLTLFVLVMGTCLLMRMPYLANVIYFYPVAYFGLFAALTLMLLSVAAYSVSKTFFYATLIVQTGICGYLVLLNADWHGFMFVLTSLLMICMFVVFLPRKGLAYKLRSLFVMLLGLVISLIPFYQTGNLYYYALEYKNIYSNLLLVLNKYPQKSVVFFTNVPDFSFPALEYTHQELASRFANLGWVPPLAYQADDNAYAQAYAKNLRTNDFFLRAITQDLNQRKPDVVFVDRRNTDSEKHYHGLDQLDYLKFFSENVGFKQSWQQYHFVKTVDGWPLFKFDVYERDGSTRTDGMVVRNGSPPARG